MAVNIETTTTTHTANERRNAFDSTGRLWTTFHDGANGRYEFWYSDDGTTFTEATSLRYTVGSAGYCSFTINKVNDRAVFYTTSGVFQVCTSITSSSTWTAVNTAVNMAYGEMVTFNKPGSSNYYIAAVGSYTAASIWYLTLYVYELNSSHSVVSTPIASQLGYAYTSFWWSAIDFRHTGDGSTVASSSPDLYVAFTEVTGGGSYMARYAWDGSGGWTGGSNRTLDTGSTTPYTAAAFDGTRFCTVFRNAAGTGIEVWERDAGDTTSTERTPTALSDGNIAGLDVTYTANGDMVVYAAGATSGDVKRLKFNRTSGTWDTWTTIEATTVYVGISATKGWASGKGVGLTWQLSTGETYSETDFVNTAPDAPTWASPVSGAAQDRGAALTLDWNFVDTDAPPDAQTAYKLKRSINGGAASWWNGTIWTTETKMTTATTQLAMSSGWGTDGDTHVYNVLTYDAADVVSPYSANLTVIASVPDNPTITAPATSATVTTSQPTISWTVTTQTAYQLDIYETDDSLLYSSGKVTSTSTSITCPYVLTNGLTDLKFKITTWNDAGLICSTPDTNTLIDVTYTPPATPVLTVTAVPASGYISVAIADPAPGATPQVVYHDVYVRVASGGTQSGERTVNDNGIRISTGTVPEDGTFYDRAAASGVSFQYRTQAFAANGATTSSAWTG